MIPPVQGDDQAPQNRGGGAPITETRGKTLVGAPSPKYVNEDHAVWDQPHLAKTLLAMKDAEFMKLRFPETSYRPYEYEKWIRGITRSMTASHPEIGTYWLRIVDSAESVYQRYLNDVSSTRVSLKPKETLNRTEIEGRIENKIRTVLMSIVPVMISQQCTFEHDLP